MMNIELVAYKPEYRQAFKDLNVVWIQKYFKMEESDYKALDHPETYILDKGGYIGFALLDGKPVGVGTLIQPPHAAFDFELAKMAVTPEVQARGIGKKLAQHLIEHARSKGAKRIYLESNTVLAPAIKLYRQLGFVEIQGYESPYERSNIQMCLELV